MLKKNQIEFNQYQETDFFLYENFDFALFQL